MNLDTLIKSHHDAKAAEAEIFELSGTGVREERCADEDRASRRLDALTTGLSALDDMVEASDVVKFFLTLAKGQGGRMLLLRQWTSGLRVLLAEGVDLPARMIDPKAGNPRIIPLKNDDVFPVLGREKFVYSGPFPRDHFPKELERELGGDENRPVLILPLPLRGRWETYVYMDWLDFTAEARIDEAALMARYAVLRLHLVDRELLPMGRRTRAILNAERRRQRERVKDRYENLKPGDLPPERIYGMVGELTAMPQVAGRILAMMDDPSTTAHQLEKEIVQDLVLTAKILRIANSSFYESVSEARTIRDAIVRLGFKSVRNWTLVNASQTVFPGVQSVPVMHRIWTRSIRSAVGAQLVAAAVDHPEREAVFVGGLIQNIGQLILARALPGLFDKIECTARERGVPTWPVEREMLGYDHGALGALLIRDWNLSDDLAKAVLAHHDLDACGGAEDMATLIALGEEIAGLESVEDEDAVRRAAAESRPAGMAGVDVETYLDVARAVAEAETEVVV